MPRVNVSGNTVVKQPVKGQREENSPNVTTTYIFLTLQSDGAEDAPNKSIDYLPYQGILTPVAGPVYYNTEDDEFIHIKVHFTLLLHYSELALFVLLLSSISLKN